MIPEWRTAVAAVFNHFVDMELEAGPVALCDSFSLRHGKVIVAREVSYFNNSDHAFVLPESPDKLRCPACLRRLRTRPDLLFTMLVPASKERRADDDGETKSTD